jgi:hypothetical protein
MEEIVKKSPLKHKPIPTNESAHAPGAEKTKPLQLNSDWSESGRRWARWASNPGPADYESAALTRLSYGPAQDGPDLSRLRPPGHMGNRRHRWEPGPSGSGDTTPWHASSNQAHGETDGSDEQPLAAHFGRARGQPGPRRHAPPVQAHLVQRNQQRRRPRRSRRRPAGPFEAFDAQPPPLQRGGQLFPRTMPRSSSRNRKRLTISM